ncbi:MAG: DUF4440 domain-containing protein [Gammaproteobacteria bacterium]|nr:DUF4440 domain-containing protein [Gammaproteobacteria bacterium]
MKADQVLDDWQRFLNQGDLENIVRLYSDEAILWGTLSSIIRDSSKLIGEYFEMLFEKDNLRVDWGTVYPRVYDGFHLYSGTYEFSYTDNKPVILPARFTFAIGDEKDASFKILAHHSSLIPGDPGP